MTRGSVATSLSSLALAVALASCAAASAPNGQDGAIPNEPDLSGMATYLDLAKPNSDAGPLMDLATADFAMPDLSTPPDLAMTVCQLALSNQAGASDATIINCATTNQLGKCRVVSCSSGCACGTYVRADGLCTGGTCAAPLSGSGCSDSTAYYGGAPWNCLATPKTACMLRKLVDWNHCQ